MVPPLRTQTHGHQAISVLNGNPEAKIPIHHELNETDQNHLGILAETQEVMIQEITEDQETQTAPATTEAATEETTEVETIHHGTQEDLEEEEAETTQATIHRTMMTTEEEEEEETSVLAGTAPTHQIAEEIHAIHAILTIPVSTLQFG